MPTAYKVVCHILPKYLDGDNYPQRATQVKDFGNSGNFNPWNPNSPQVVRGQGITGGGGVEIEIINPLKIKQIQTGNYYHTLTPPSQTIVDELTEMKTDIKKEGLPKQFGNIFL